MTSEIEVPKKENNQGEKFSKKQIRNLEIFIIILGAINILYAIVIMVLGKPLDWVIILVLALLTFAPAFIANMGMTIVGTIGKWNRPIDSGKNFIDGERLFGDGKTVKGFLGGIVVGLIFSPLFLLIHFGAQNVANLEMLIQLNGEPVYYLAMKLIRFEDFTRILAIYPVSLLLLHIPKIILLSIGGPTGDLVGSFFKRRLKYPRGAQFPVVDQIDFILISILFTFWFYPLTFQMLLIYIFILIFTPLITLFANFIGYKIGRKKEPW